MASQVPSRQYFASLPTDEFNRALRDKLRQAGESRYFRQLIDRAHTAYLHTFGDDWGLGDTSRVLRNGDRGELAQIRINNAPAFARAQHALVTAAKVAWRPVATNEDASAQAANILATALLEYYWKHKRMQVHVSRWTMQAIRYGEAFSFAQWDYGQGPAVGTSADGQRVEHAGDMVFHNLPPWDVRRDGAARNWDQSPWVAVRLWLSRWDIAALSTPSDSDVPLDAEGKDASDAIYGASPWDDIATEDQTRHEGESDDIIPAWYFFHKKTPACPDGLEALLVGSAILHHEVLSYPELPVVRMAADERDGTSFGNSSYHDILGIQELKDSLASSVSSNQLALSTQSLWMPSGTKVSVDNVHGLKVFEGRPGEEKPQALQLTASPPEVFNWMNQLKGEQMAILGLNDTSLGQPQEKLAGNAYALLYSAAAQQNSGLQGAMVAGVSDLGTLTIKCLNKFVSAARMVLITGKSTIQQYRQLEYTGADLDGVERVNVEIGNPLEQSVPGKMELLNTYRQVGAITEADHVVQVVETGRIEPATNAKRAEMQLLQYEREELAQGRNPIVHTYQNHVLHAKEHKSVLDDPEALKNPAIVQAVQEHNDWHYRELYGLPDEVPVQADPLFLPRMRAMLGYGELTPDLLQGPPQPPPGQGPPGEGEGAPPESMQLPAGTSPAGPNGAQAPKYPVNPVTGEQVNPQAAQPPQV